MTKTEMLDKIEALRCVINDCETQINDIKEKLEEQDTPRPWVPLYGEQYFLIYHNASIGHFPWYNDKTDKHMLSIGNMFRTREDAEFMLERLKVLAELRRLTNGFVPDWWNGDQEKYVLQYYSEDDEIDIKHYFVLNHGAPVYFQSEEDAKAAVEAIGVDRLKKYYFMMGGDGE